MRVGRENIHNTAMAVKISAHANGGATAVQAERKQKNKEKLE
jgi:hypothetical protein